jgi:hypothetical protein
MIEKKDILAMVRHVTRHSRGVRDPQIVHPMREWMLGVGFVAIGVLVGGLYSFMVYNRTLSDQLEQPIVAVPRAPYQATVVEQALTKYGDRRAQYDAILDRTPAPVPVEIDNDLDLIPVTPPELPAEQSGSEDELLPVVPDTPVMPAL